MDLPELLRAMTRIQLAELRALIDEEEARRAVEARAQLRLVGVGD